MNDPFFPKGAIAAFGVLVVVYAVVWFGVYSLLVGRG